MPILIYIVTFLWVFVLIYIFMPLVVGWIVRRWLLALPGKLSGQFASDIRGYLKRPGGGVLPELKGQVIAHLVEPWLDKFTGKCIDVVANGSGRAIADKYGEILIATILKRRLLLSVLVSQVLSLAVVVGYYLELLTK